LIALTAAALSDLSGVDTWPDFRKFLLDIHARSGYSYSDLELLSRELHRGTVSDALHGTRPIARTLLECLLEAWGVRHNNRVEVLQAWTRVTAESRRRSAWTARFDEMSPRELGVHPAIRMPGATDELPRYVRRRFDAELEESIADGARRGCFVLLVGRSSTGKTRSLYEAVYKTVPNWWIAQPSSIEGILELAAEPAERTILWLDELHRFLGSSPPLTHRLISGLRRAGVIVVGTLWSDEYTALRGLRPATGSDPHADDRTLLESATVVTVRPDFHPEEQAAAREMGKEDDRIRIALRSKDAGMTQVLAAGPDLVQQWEHAPAYARAAMTAAADARRLGVHTALAPELLIEAMTGYLTPADRVSPPATWLEAATTYGRRQLNGEITALSPVAGRRPGVLAGYLAADYLAQHLARVRRTQCPPESTWMALIDRLENVNDLRRVCTSAAARMRYQHWERGLRRLSALGDGPAHIELAMLLTRQNRIPEAIIALRDRVADRDGADALARVIALGDRADRLRADDTATRGELNELLYDEGEAADLRRAADAGDQVAADDLAGLLAERGAIAELRRRANAGHRLAADLLAELLATHRRLPELRQRAESGDEAAATRLNKIEAEGDEPGDAAIDAQISDLRAAVDDGTRHAAEQLTTLLFELRREADLRAEVDAGTPYAAERLLALLTADRCDDPAGGWEIIRLRAFGLDADDLTDGGRPA
jgi:hypothetical protein